jgi:hypothetical protein
VHLGDLGVNDQKDWDAPDIQIESVEIILEVPAASHIEK